MVSFVPVKRRAFSAEALSNFTNCSAASTAEITPSSIPANKIYFFIKSIVYSLLLSILLFCAAKVAKKREHSFSPCSFYLAGCCTMYKRNNLKREKHFPTCYLCILITEPTLNIKLLPIYV